MSLVKLTVAQEVCVEDLEGLDAGFDVGLDTEFSVELEVMVSVGLDVTESEGRLVSVEGLDPGPPYNEGVKIH